MALSRKKIGEQKKGVRSLKLAFRGGTAAPARKNANFKDLTPEFTSFAREFYMQIFAESSRNILMVSLL
jgi:hypothetical protein